MSRPIAAIMLPPWFRLVAVLLLSGVLADAWGADAGVPVHYQLPSDGPLPRTYRVTLAVSDAADHDWLVATFVAGGVRTVTAENQGRFTDYWNGLDDNGMPVPAGDYGVKGIFMPARQWEINGDWHTIVPKFVAAVGDSWQPAPGEDQRFPWIYGHCFGFMGDIQVGPNGKAAFLSNYLENSFNPFLVDLNRPIGYDQVLAKFGSGGAAGGSAVACDGEVIWTAINDAHQSYIHRADGKPFGSDRATYVNGVVLLRTPATSMCVWRDPKTHASFLHASLAGDDNQILTLDGETGRRLATTPLNGPVALCFDRTGDGSRLLALHATAKDAWAVSAIAVRNGLPAGAWTQLFAVNGIAAASDCDCDAKGDIYISDQAGNQVCKFDRAGKLLLKFAKGAQQPGRYDANTFLQPVRLAYRKAEDGKDHLLVIEHGGAGRISEWTSTGQLVRQWFLSQNANFGYYLDPESPQHVYLPSNGADGITRFLVDYDHPGWTVDAIWPEIGRQDNRFPSGFQFGQVTNLGGHKYLAFAGGAFSGQAFIIYRQQGDQWLPAAGLVQTGKDQRFWWHDANGDGQQQPAEYQDSPANLPVNPGYWGERWLDDLSLVMRKNGSEYWRLAPSGFDEHGNPVYDGSRWSRLLTDSVYAARAAGTADATHGGNEVANGYSDWATIDGTMADGFYIADPSGPGNPGGIDNAGSRYAQFKLSRYAPDGKGGLAMKWRVGRKAWRLANPGEVYATQHTWAPVNGILGTFDSNGLYHLYSDEGLYVDTVMNDSFRHGLEKGGAYSHGGESWYARHFLNRTNGKVYLFMGRSAGNIYELQGWTAGDNSIKPITTIDPAVVLTAADIAPANEFALTVRGGASAARIARFFPAAGGGPALDGSLTGWAATTPLTFQLDEQRQVEVRPLYDQQHLYLRFHVRLPAEFAPQELGDATRIFTHGRAADTVSFYIQGDPNAKASAEEGRPGDLRVVFAIVKDGDRLKPIALAMHPHWAGDAPPTKVVYSSPVGTTTYAHVGLLADAKLGHAIDQDGKGFVIAAAIPTAAIPRLPPISGSLRTQVDFAATLGGIANFWWANSGRTNNTITVDEPAEARMYPGAWAQAQFVGMDNALVVREWLVCGPWGGEKLKQRPNDPHPQPLANAFTEQFFAAATYPPDDGVIDLATVYNGPLTQDVAGKPHSFTWQKLASAKDTIEPFGAVELGYACTWIWLPEAAGCDCVFQIPDGGGSKGWINDQPLAQNGGKLQAKQNVAFRKGWNKILLRGYAVWGKVRFGLQVNCPPEILWSAKIAATPP